MHGAAFANSRVDTMLPGLRLVLSVAIAAGMAGTAADEPEMLKPTLCLYAEEIGKVCSEGGDPNELANDPDIRRAIRTLGLDGKTIRFVGCEGGVFATQDLSPSPSKREYKISYPAFEPGRGKYLAPITHELSHVLQLQRAGSMAKLTQEREKRSIELAADFISGMVFKRTHGMSRINTYQQNLKLVGRYKESATDAHGTWPQRTSAFRRGVFLRDDLAKMDIRYADSTFREKLYKDIFSYSSEGEGTPEGNETAEGKRGGTREWNKLSACDAVTGLYQSLMAPDASRIGTVCRSPRGELETEVYGRLRANYRGQPCLLSTSPSPILNGFACFHHQLPSGASLYCIRKADPKIIELYRADELQLAAAAYMNSASSCGKSVDTSVAVESTFPDSLALVSKFEFGFIRAVGEGIPAPSNMTHGYAQLDPALEVSGVTFIEYISTFSGAGMPPAPPALPSKRVAHWQITIDSYEAENREMNISLQEAGAPPAFHQAQDFTVALAQDSNLPPINKREKFRSWNAALHLYLKQEGLVLIPSEKIGLTEKVIRKMIEDHQVKKPFGRRKWKILSDKADKKPITVPDVYIDDKLAACTAKGQGAYIAFIFRREPNPSEKKDYGEVAITVIAVGSCGNAPAAKRYVNELQDNLAESFFHAIGETK